MSIKNLLMELNKSQKTAATHLGTHALVLAGAGCGKTKTIIARAAFLISQGTPAGRIQVLAFTRRSAAEIVERVKTHIGEDSQGLKASTFHAWCISLIRGAPNIFGYQNFTVIDRDDQLQLFKLLRGKKARGTFPTAAGICDLYSYARNTRSPLDKCLKKQMPSYCSQITKIANIMMEYEKRKRSRNYLDYDDILDIVAKGMQQSDSLCKWIGSQYDHILVDEMQDTNLLQWELLNPLTKYAKLFCVGDDAQSIYGFRGADFSNVHSFKERLPDSTILKLEDNYRSTQEILEFSNWLLLRSPINYDKKLKAVRGKGIHPQIHTFSSSWEEGRWVAEDLTRRKEEGRAWKEHMLLVRSGFAARPFETALIAKDIPYVLIGGTKLFQSAHIKDVLSVLKLIANNRDDISWMRFLTIWPKVGEVTASRIIEKIINFEKTEESLKILNEEGFGKSDFTRIIRELSESNGTVAGAIAKAVKLMTPELSDKYRNKNWDKRQFDFKYIEKLAEKHTSILAFLEEYVLDPIYETEKGRLENEDVVTMTTIHSAKGTEREVCYVVDVSVKAYPSKFAIGSPDEVEEERRVLYVALTRAKNELILTRNISQGAHTTADGKDDKLVESYFLDVLPESVITEHIYTSEEQQYIESDIECEKIKIDFGIDLGVDIRDSDEKETKAPKRIEPTDLTNLVLVEGGSFKMGVGNIFEVTVSSFEMRKYPVTQKEWKEVMGSNPSEFKKDNLPVESITWLEAARFCNKLSKLEGLSPVYIIKGVKKVCDWKANGYRLPTEMEWEWAARGGLPAQRAGTFNTTYAGSNTIDDVAWYGINSGSTTHPVGTKAPNELGLYDMTGNVWEWCWDWFDWSYPAGSFTNPTGPNSGSARMVRGGSWGGSASVCTVSDRYGVYPGTRGSYFGFRPLRAILD